MRFGQMICRDHLKEMMQMGIDRRGFLAGSVTGLSMVASPAVAELAYKDFGKFSQETFEPDKPVTAIVIGAGNRGHVYGNYALSQPKQLNIVGVAEPIALRRDGFGDAQAIDEKNRFETWEHVFEREKFADAVIISTPDNLHFEPLLRAASMGYHVLLEKPMAQSMEECLEIAKAIQDAGVIAGVAHVLRYSPYFREMKAMIDRGDIGDLVSINHVEPIHYIHMHILMCVEYGKT
jgi:predicted dehydrogenase